MDLANLKISQEAYTMPLLHPVTGKNLTDDDGVNLSIDILSSDTNIYKSEFIKLMKEARANEDEAPRETERKACMVLAKISTGCHLIVEGKKLKHSVDAMADIYFTPEYSWIKEQVEKAIRSRENFIQG